MGVKYIPYRHQTTGATLYRTQFISGASQLPAHLKASVSGTKTGISGARVGAGEYYIDSKGNVIEQLEGGVRRIAGSTSGLSAKYGKGVYKIAVVDGKTTISKIVDGKAQPVVSYNLVQGKMLGYKEHAAPTVSIPIKDLGVQEVKEVTRVKVTEKKTGVKIVNVPVGTPIKALRGAVIAVAGESITSGGVKYVAKTGVDLPTSTPSPVVSVVKPPALDVKKTRFTEFEAGKSSVSVSGGAVTTTVELFVPKKDFEGVAGRVVARSRAQDVLASLKEQGFAGTYVIKKEGNRYVIVVSAEQKGRFDVAATTAALETQGFAVDDKGKLTKTLVGKAFESPPVVTETTTSVFPSAFIPSSPLTFVERELGKKELLLTSGLLDFPKYAEKRAEEAFSLQAELIGARQAEVTPLEIQAIQAQNLFAGRLKPTFKEFEATQEAIYGLPVVGGKIKDWDEWFSLAEERALKDDIPFIKDVISIPLTLGRPETWLKTVYGLKAIVKEPTALAPVTAIGAGLLVKEATTRPVHFAGSILAFETFGRGIIPVIKKPPSMAGLKIVLREPAGSLIAKGRKLFSFGDFGTKKGVLSDISHFAKDEQVVFKHLKYGGVEGEPVVAGTYKTVFDVPTGLAKARVLTRTRLPPTFLESVLGQKGKVVSGVSEQPFSFIEAFQEVSAKGVKLRFKRVAEPVKAPKDFGVDWVNVDLREFRGGGVPKGVQLKLQAEMIKSLGDYRERGGYFDTKTGRFVSKRGTFEGIVQPSPEYYGFRGDVYGFHTHPYSPTSILGKSIPKKLRGTGYLRERTLVESQPLARQASRGDYAALLWEKRAELRARILSKPHATIKGEFILAGKGITYLEPLGATGIILERRYPSWKQAFEAMKEPRIGITAPRLTLKKVFGKDVLPDTALIGGVSRRVSGVDGDFAFIVAQARIKARLAKQLKLEPLASFDPNRFVIVSAEKLKGKYGKQALSEMLQLTQKQVVERGGVKKPPLLMEVPAGAGKGEVLFTQLTQVKQKAIAKQAPRIAQKQVAKQVSKAYKQYYAELGGQVGVAVSPAGVAKTKVTGLTIQKTKPKPLVTVQKPVGKVLAAGGITAVKASGYSLAPVTAIGAGLVSVQVDLPRDVQRGLGRTRVKTQTRAQLKMVSERAFEDAVARQTSLFKLQSRQVSRGATRAVSRLKPKSLLLQRAVLRVSTRTRVRQSQRIRTLTEVKTIVPPPVVPKITIRTPPPKIPYGVAGAPVKRFKSDIDLKDFKPRVPKRKELAPLADLFSKAITELRIGRPAKSPSVKTARKFFFKTGGLRVPTAEMIRKGLNKDGVFKA